MEKIFLFNIDIFQYHRLSGLVQAMGIESELCVPSQQTSTINQLYCHQSSNKKIEKSFQESLAIFCHLSEQQMDQVLMIMRQYCPIELKAVLTKYNRDWTIVQLVENLKIEKARLNHLG